MGKKKDELKQLKRLELYEIKELCELLDQVKKLDRKIDEIIRLLKKPGRAIRDLVLTQENTTMGKIVGIKPGATETFDLSFIPPNGQLAPGTVPSFTQDNTTDVSPLSASADGSQFSVTGAASFAATSFNVTASVQTVNTDGTPNPTPVTKVFNIPLLSAAPVGIPITDLDLNQEGA